MMFRARASEAQQVAGERGAALVHAASSVQSRLSGALAAGLMLLLGVCALSWYYAHALTRQQTARESARAASRDRAQGEMPLPSLGHIAPPPTAAPAVPQPTPTVSPQPDLPLAESAALPATGAPERSADAASPAAGNAPPVDRRLEGAVFTRAGESAGTTGAAAGAEAPRAALPADTSGIDARPSSRGEDVLGALLRPHASAAVAAQRLPDARLLLPKGAFIDCTLETAIDSTLPGMTTCITAADTFGADGKVVLLERGTKLVGETRGQVQQGQARVFVAWAEARTPTGVIVPLDSPGTDELGRSGLPGAVEHHFWQRFGAALLISVVDGAVQVGVQASSRSGSAVVYAPSSSQDVLTEVLKGTVNIAPTVVKRNGDRIQVLVARDVDFRPVYELRAAAGR
jgi:type IV secretion system protein VirB10